MRLPIPRFWGAGLCLVLLLLLLPASASAHATLVSSHPRSGTRLPEAPPALELRFSEAVEAEFTPLTVQDISGVRVDAGDARVHAEDRTLVTVSLKPLPPGVYTALYRVTSADAHPIQGTVVLSGRRRGPEQDGDISGISVRRSPNREHRAGRRTARHGLAGRPDWLPGAGLVAEFRD